MSDSGLTLQSNFFQLRTFNLTLSHLAFPGNEFQKVRLGVGDIDVLQDSLTHCAHSAMLVLMEPGPREQRYRDKDFPRPEGLVYITMVEHNTLCLNCMCYSSRKGTK